MVCWSPTQLNSKQVVSPLHFKVGASYWPQMASDWLHLTSRILPKFCREDRNKYRVRGRGRPEEKLKLNTTLKMSHVYIVTARSPIMLDATRNVSLIDMKSHVIQPQPPQPSNTPHTSHRNINHQQRKYYEIKFHS